MTVADLFTLQIMLDDGDWSHVGTYANFDLDAAVAEAEENLTDLLPPGYRARIRRWDHPDTEGADDE